MNEIQPNLSNYNDLALAYAERYGIIDYKVNGNTMTYQEHFPSEGTYEAVLNLDTRKEVRKLVAK